MKTFHFLFTSFVKQLSDFEDFLDYRFEFQFAISATIGRPFLFLAHIDTAVRLEIFPRLVFPAGLEITALAFIWVVIPQTLQFSKLG